MSHLTLIDSKGEPRVDTRLLAEQLGLQHPSVYKLVNDYQDDFEAIGKVRFEIGPSAAGQKIRFALLNEDQAYLLLTYSRNTKKVRELKVKLVLAFREARQSKTQDTAEYLPTYHALHELIHEKAAHSKNERFVHTNINKLVNKTVGIEPGTRSKLPFPKKALLVVAQSVAASAMGKAVDHHDGYQNAKEALGRLGQVLLTA